MQNIYSLPSNVTRLKGLRSPPEDVYPRWAYILNPLAFMWKAVIPLNLLVTLHFQFVLILMASFSE